MLNFIPIPGPMSHLFMGVQEQSYIAHVVEHATETWKRDGFKRVLSAAPSTTVSGSILVIVCALLTLNL